MNAIERLRRDHRLLRAKLDVLETGLRMGPETWFVLREVSFTLARQLQDHLRREEGLVAACRKALTPTLLAELAVEHKDEPRHLQAINRLFVSDTGHSLERIRPVLAEVIQGLRRHMAEEETGLFPILDRTLAEQEREAHRQAAPPGRVDETMTVNRVLQECPGTRPTFEQLFINVPLEGCACLDEVAWRHGMEAKELVERLEDAIARCPCGARAAAPAGRPEPSEDDAVPAGTEPA